MSSTYIQTLSGGKFDFLNPEAYFQSVEADALIEEIAGALGKICRFGAHCSQFYSVAGHSVIGTTLSAEDEKDLSLQFLFHDAAEAYLGDVPTPLKAHLPDYRAIEANVEKALFKRLAEIIGMTYPFHPNIRKYDLIMLKAEKDFLLIPDDKDWPCFEVLSEVDLVCAGKVRRCLEDISYTFDPIADGKVFLSMYKELMKC